VGRSASRYRHDPDHYLNSPRLLLVQHYQRLVRRIHLHIEGIEPRAKHSMPESDKDAIQRRVLQEMVRMHRRSFRGPLALSLTLATTERTPTHSHQITKNLLELFAVPRPAVSTHRRGLLYADDSQVHALSVTCHHGQETPMIRAVATPMGTLLEDLGLAVRAAQERGDDHPEWAEQFGLDRAIDEVRDLQRNEALYRGRIGDQGYESMLRFARQLAQESLLGRVRLRPIDLAKMYNVSNQGLGFNLGSIWEEMYVSTRLGVQLSELPQVSGGSTQWRQEIETKLRAFQMQYGWLMNPLPVPVALKVVIKPPPPRRQNGLHDLDNVLRTYLIPRVVEILRPVSHIAFTRDDSAEVMRAAGRTFPVPTPPPSTKWGVSRYEAWRLPPADEGSRGFVSAAIVADLSGCDDTLGQIDDEIEAYRNYLAEQ
jgi:hypothetical protein